MEMALDGKSSLKQAVDVSDDLKDRLKQIIGRIEKLEIYSTKQTDITSNLQKHIVDADKWPPPCYVSKWICEKL